MKHYTLQLPEGVKDFLGSQKQLKEAVESTLKHLFCKHAYNLIETPTFEYLDVWTAGDQSIQAPNLYKWANHQGEIVALRSDMTRSIARVVATQNSMKALPQRYTYVANVFRYPERYQGKQHEFTQAGIELIGQASYASDAEVIMLSIEALKAVGINDMTVHIGSAKFLREMLDELGATNDEKQAIYACIEAKDAVGLQQVLGTLTGEVADAVVKLLQRSGSIELVREMKAKLTSGASYQALCYLEDLYTVLEDFGVADKIIFDFSLLSYASYYTGIMFQVFTKGVGTAVVEGGRYDKLLAQFGKDLPAVGMAMHIDALLPKLQTNCAFEEKKATLILWDKPMAKVAIQIANNYRQEGLTVAYAMTQSVEEARAYAEAEGMGGVMHFREDAQVVIYPLDGGEQFVVALDTLGGEEDA